MLNYPNICMKSLEYRLMLIHGLINSKTEIEIPILLLQTDEILLKLRSPPLETISRSSEELKTLEKRIIVIQKILHTETCFEKLAYVNQESPSLCSSSVEEWVNNIGVSLYDARDVLDDLTIDLDHRSVEIGMDSVAMLVERLDSVIWNLRKSLGSPEYIHSPSIVFGRDEDVKRIVDLLLLQREETAIVPILAEDGLGKTTVAQLVYNHYKVQTHFDITLWITVPILHDTKLLMRLLVESATGKTPLDFVTLTGLQLVLENVILGKKVLLVLDDVFSYVLCDWDVLFFPFRFADKASRVLVTTACHTVCSVLGTAPPYRLHPLPYEDCWSLFIHVTAGDTIPQEQLQVCQLVVRLIQGVPSLIMGFRICLKSSLHASVKSMLCTLGDDTTSLLWSYLRLPPRLKQCFAFCSKHRYGFKRNTLISLWMAEGFLQPNEAIRMEDLGVSYLNELERVNLIKYVKTLHNEPIYTLPQEAETLAKEVYLDVSKYKNYLPLPKSFTEVQSLSNIFLSRAYLRVVNLYNRHLIELPDSIGCLRHLRFLDVSWNRLTRLPDSMSKLYSLQMLDVRHNHEKLNNLHTVDVRFDHEGLKFPKDMSKLCSLRHLFLDAHYPSPMPLEVGKLTALQTLSLFTVGKESAYGDICQLEYLTQLRGAIVIRRLENVLKVEMAQRARLVDKEFDRLELSWSVCLEDAELAENILTSLNPNTSLKHLVIQMYGGIKFPSWVGNPSFNNLETVCLAFCFKTEIIPPLGQLPSLKSIRLISCGVKYLDRELCENNSVEGFSCLGFNFLEKKTSFPSLETLELKDLPLKKWTGLKNGDMPRLRKLVIGDCENLVSLPTLRFLNSLQELEIYWCPKLGALPQTVELKSLKIRSCPLLEYNYKKKLQEIGRDLCYLFSWR